MHLAFCSPVSESSSLVRSLVRVLRGRVGALHSRAGSVWAIVPKLKALLAWRDVYPVTDFAFSREPVCGDAQPLVEFVRASEMYPHQLPFMLNFIFFFF